jgi:hypothetical protein
MANKVTPHLKPQSNNDTTLITYDHASRLYVDNYYELAPKAGWLYYVEFNINPEITLQEPGLDVSWFERYKKVGVLAKNINMPGFDIKTEALNQYNRKSYIQTSIDYKPIAIQFHDDMANVTNYLWKNYYNYYYADGAYGNSDNAKNLAAFSDNKLQDLELGVFPYGLNTPHNYKFFTTIDIYLLNKQKYTSITLVNPIVKNWSHGKLDQESTKDFLENTMTVEYEAVFYDLYNNSSKDIGFNDARFYGKNKSYLKINEDNTTPYQGGEDLYGKQETVENTKTADDKKIQEEQSKKSRTRRIISAQGKPILNSAYSVLKGVAYKAATSKVGAAIDVVQSRIQNSIGGEVGRVLGGAIGSASTQFFRDKANETIKQVIKTIPKRLDPNSRNASNNDGE